MAPLAKFDKDALFSIVQKFGAAQSLDASNFQENA
jgi:hypothetical protein